MSSNLAFSVPGEDAVLVAINAKSSRVCLKVGKFPQLLANHRIDTAVHAVIHVVKDHLLALASLYGTLCGRYNRQAYPSHSRS
jgi:hypothetical protein